MKNLFFRLLFIFIFLTLNFDLSICESGIDNNITTENTTNNIEDSRNFIERNSIEICLILFAISLCCMVYGINLVENAES